MTDNERRDLVEFIKELAAVDTVSLRLTPHWPALESGVWYSLMNCCDRLGLVKRDDDGVYRLAYVTEREPLEVCDA